MSDIVSVFYPETSAGGFSRKDGTVQFYQRVQALLRPNDAVLDFGAGRGAAHYVDESAYRRRLRDLRGAGRRVVGADVDPIVSTNPTLDEAVVIYPETPLPFPDNTFDLIVSDSTFEHIADGVRTAAELDRVLKPGGWLCVRTPNRNGYVALANRMMRGRLGKRVVLAAQPDRKAEDVFPAHYRMNGIGALKTLFPADRYRHAIFAIDSEPRYHFNRRLIFRFMQAIHSLTPPAWRNTLLCFLHKRNGIHRAHLCGTSRVHVRRCGFKRSQLSVRIFLAATSLLPAYGGPAVSVTRLAAALADAGAEVGLWAADQSATSTELLPRDSSVQRLAGTATYALAAFGRADVVHDNGLWLTYHHRLAALANGQDIPRIVSTRGMLEPWAINHKRWKKSIAWRLYQRHDLMKSACHHVTAEAEACNVRRLGLGVPVRMVPNGVDIPTSNGDAAGVGCRKPSAIRTVLFLGRIYPVKGLPMLVEAWARVRPEGWRLQVAGPDEAGHRAQVENAVLAAGLGEAVSFLGPLEGENKRSAFLDADLFVLPTYSESFGMVIAEALAHGLPVLTTTGAPWPLLPERDCGWRVEPTVEAIAAGLRQATSLNREILSAMGARGRKWVAEDFGWDRVAKQFMGLYEDMLGRGNGDARYA